ncbi:MAG TPA: hypothetical protein VIU41_06975, partial [Geobacteraceae bacterium]
MKIVRLVIGRLAALSMAASLLLLGGCSSLKVTETWHATGKSGKQYHKLMVLGILNDENRRSMAENIVVDEFQRQGVGAVASHAYVKYLDNLTRDDVVAAVKAAGADALILVRPISIGDQKVTQEGQAGKV